MFSLHGSDVRLNEFDMLDGIKNRTERFTASVLTTYLGILVALVLAVHTSTITLLSAASLGVVLLFVTGIAEYVLTYSPLLRYRDRRLSTFFEDYLGLIENDIETMAPGDVDARANVMRPSSDGFRDDPTLSIAYYNDRSDYDPGEFELEFEIGQGCVGQAYETGDQTFAISPNHVRSWDDSWETTERQDRVTEHLNTIIGTPVYRPEDEEREDDPVAVLISDSEQHIDRFIHLGPNQEVADVDFEDTEIGERAVDHARNMGILL